jgi:hypothetical protein
VRKSEGHDVMRGIRIFEHDADGQLISRIEADRGVADSGREGAVWHLEKSA